ncbi:hypothetical protein AVEN_3833-1 [Araneus ventricosus]|uniref:Uncharacterized protein n=1 Tax=Araneus ventricosus TaxID=182803 RepID=A0A4Y2GNR8_ARAVE|nr:hypothetical protein AVEN_3833-1 [Araneus ventricosus]
MKKSQKNPFVSAVQPTEFLSPRIVRPRLKTSSEPANRSARKCVRVVILCKSSLCVMPALNDSEMILVVKTNGSRSGHLGTLGSLIFLPKATRPLIQASQDHTGKR